MENITEFKEFLREELLELQASKPDQKGVMVRCPFCGDSVKSFDHGHMLVWINFNDDEHPITYNCLRCNESGIFTQNTLRELDITSSELNIQLTLYNSQCKRIGGSMSLRNSGGYDYKVPPYIKDIGIARRKLDYLNWRLGLSLDFADYIKLRVAFNLLEVLVYNKIDLTKITKKKTDVINLHKDYVGFLTTRREFSICRDITGKHQLRYDAYRFNKNKTDEVLTKLYIIPTLYDIMSTQQIDVHISEGTFDILGIYFNIKNQKTENQIYMAVCGCGFWNGIKYLIGMGIFGKNVRVHLYSDKDKTPIFYKRMIKRLKNYVGEVYLYYNELQKDYGVPKEKIRLTYTKM